MMSSEEMKACLSLETLESKKRKWEEEGRKTLQASKKRKWEEGGQKSEQTMAIADIELHLDTPLPSDWQRCLDIKSGKIHYYNTKTQKRTCTDPRYNQKELISSSVPRLNLDLNLMCEPPRRDTEEEQGKINRQCMSRSLSWISLDADEPEMVAAVCMRCHMLVMMCKAMPSCPNCKFVHSVDQNPSVLLKQGFRVLYCKD